MVDVSRQSWGSSPGPSSSFGPMYRPVSSGEGFNRTVVNVKGTFQETHHAMTSAIKLKRTSWNQWFHEVLSCANVALGNEPRINCRVCYSKAAATVESPCGHVTTCRECSLAYKSPKCMVCGTYSRMRCDVTDILGPEPAQRPPMCYLCKEREVNVLLEPCEHLTCCTACFKKSHKGCPKCGERVMQRTVILWNDDSLTTQAAELQLDEDGND